ncbi:nitroreductase/quinone reductase family protein [Streptomyces sp. YGL11-2]|uniref:nitroreductase/quinone reductase family protein n=1 Tax=Streptomyces sp. YGL11-2 TaxID=3414028 RepID=UPI003CF6CB00
MTIRPLVTRIGRTRAFTTLAPHLLPRVDRAAHRLTGGRWLPSRALLPTVMLVTTGHRSGLARTTALCAHRFADGSWLVAATNFGRPHHPAWSTNLLHAPHAVVVTNRERHPVTAELLPVNRLPEYRQQLLCILPVFDDYAARTARDIRVFYLTPLGLGAGPSGG